MKCYCTQQYKFFDTIANRSRWNILELLATAPKNVSQIAEVLKEEQSAVSHNLKKLTNCNVIKVEQIGKKRIYSLNKETILPLMQLVEKHVGTYCRGRCTA